jgi:hypothetical protein
VLPAHLAVLVTGRSNISHSRNLEMPPRRHSVGRRADYFLISIQRGSKSAHLHAHSVLCIDLLGEVAGVIEQPVDRTTRLPNETGNGAN